MIAVDHRLINGFHESVHVDGFSFKPWTPKTYAYLHEAFAGLFTRKPLTCCVKISLPAPGNSRLLSSPAGAFVSRKEFSGISLPGRSQKNSRQKRFHPGHILLLGIMPKTTDRPSAKTNRLANKTDDGPAPRKRIEHLSQIESLGARPVMDIPGGKTHFHW